MDFDKVDKFGAVDADTDDLLLDCFQDHEAYLSAKNHQKFLIVGRKGSGKTAIFRKLVSEISFDRFCTGHSFSDYPWFHHDKQKKTGVPENECFRYSWEYVILISVAKILISENASLWSDQAVVAMSKLESFIIDSYGTRTPELNTIFSPETKIKIKPSLSVNFGALKASAAPEVVEMTNLPIVIYEINSALSDAVIQSLNPEFSYQICFDELDRGFDIADENYRLRLIGLLIAARDFNKKMRLANRRMSAIVFLREDILRYLRFEDKNKIVEDFSTIIEWDKSAHSRSLKNIMAKRFAKIFDIEEDGAWEFVFDDALMPGRQPKFQYMLDRTFKRPRDIIKYSNEVLNVYKSSKSDAQRFENVHLRDARQEHSKYMRKELTDEIHQYFPHEEAAFSMLRTIGQMSFTIMKFGEVYVETSKTKVELPSAPEILRTLYSFSVIGFLKVGGAGGGSEWVWRYEDIDADYDERATVFRVHPALKDNLGLKQGRAHGSAESSTTIPVTVAEAEIDAD